MSKIFYDNKRRQLNFDVLGLPSFSSNISNKMTYGMLCSQFCRFISVCNFMEDFFLFNCKLFITGIKFQQNDIALGILIKLINKFEDSKTLFFTLKLTYK